MSPQSGSSLETVTILAVLIASACLSEIAQAQRLQQVRIALSTPTPPMAPLYIAKDKKIYEKYGLDVQLILVNSGSLAAQIFQAGKIQITANAPASLVSLAAAQRETEAIVDSSWLKRLDSEKFFDLVYRENSQWHF